MQQTRRVTVSDAKGYDPRNLVLQDTDTVIWINTETVASGKKHRPVPDDASLTWVANDIPPNSPSSQANFTTLGEYKYHDGHNAALKASILVTKGVVIGQNGNTTLFVPASVSIKKGQSVTWANETPLALQPKPDTGPAWFNAPIASGQISAPIKFNTVGRFPYRCSVPGQPDTTGTIEVTA